MLSLLHSLRSSFLASLLGENESPLFAPARARWIRAITKVRLQFQEVKSLFLLLPISLHEELGGVGVWVSFFEGFFWWSKKQLRLRPKVFPQPWDAQSV